MSISRSGVGIHQTSDFWDCECDKNYIHSKLDFECVKCGATEDDQPDSVIEEIIGRLKAGA